MPALSDEMKKSSGGKDKRHQKFSLYDPSSYPTPEELSQLASLLAKEGRLRDGDDSTMIVVYLCPTSRTIYDEHSLTICGNYR